MAAADGPLIDGEESRTFQLPDHGTFTRTRLVKRVVSHAPVRTADLGGWTDTWFAKSGAVCNIAVESGVHVHVYELIAEREGHLPSDAVILQGNQIQSQSFRLSQLSSQGAPACPDPILCAALLKHPLPFAALIDIFSEVPGGSGLGTSASVSVALLSALHAARGCFPSQLALAYEAHQIETGAGLQSGVQDQLAAALGGVNFFEISYPHVREHRALLDDSLRTALDQRLITIFLGTPRSSSVVHDMVIASLEGRDNTAILAPLCDAAVQGYAYLNGSDLEAYGAQLTRNNESQRALHRDLISQLADDLIDIARNCGARGWKVNGAGGDGGSMCILGPDSNTAHTAMLTSIQELSRTTPIRVLDLHIAPTGVRVETYSA
eukprot:m.257734 g.257734  ORF g.257734 m.257734 type:complete len:379 (-) comp21026_c0_seq1:383-1519(-)